MVGIGGTETLVSKATVPPIGGIVYNGTPVLPPNPDGSTPTAGLNQIYISRDDGSEPYALTSAEEDLALFGRVGHNWHPVVSPDMSRIAYLVSDQSFGLGGYDNGAGLLTTELRIMRIDGKAKRIILPRTPLNGFITPHWHPNGYILIGFGGTGGADLLQWIYADDAVGWAGLTNVPITGFATGISDTSFSPDGTKVLWANVANHNIYQVAFPAGGVPVQITTDGVATPGVPQHYDPIYDLSGNTLYFETLMVAADGAHPAGQWALQFCAPVNAAPITTVINDGNVWSRGVPSGDGRLRTHGIIYGQDIHFSLKGVSQDGHGNPISYRGGLQDVWYTAYPDVIIDKFSIGKIPGLH